MTTQEQTIHDELVDELRLLVDGLKDDTERGSGPREYLNGLLRDVYVLEETAVQFADHEDAAWLQPFVEALLTKLELGPAILPAAASTLTAAIERVGRLRSRNELLANLRQELPALLESKAALRDEARSYLEKSNVEAALTSKRLLKATGTTPPEVALAARLLEGLGLHLALNRAENAKGPADDTCRSLANKLEGWLAEAGATELRPQRGLPADQATTRTVQGSLRAPNVRSGCVAEVLTPGFSINGGALCRPVVVASAGAEAKVLAAARDLLQGVEEDAARRVLPFLEAVGAALTSRMEDSEASQESRAAAALDVVGAVMPVLESSEAQTTILKALAEDFPGTDVELLLPAPGAQMAEGVGWEARDVFSDDVAVGTIVKLLRPGMKLGGALVKPALVQVSQGPPPPGALDEVLELLPADEPRAEHLKTRLHRARCQAASDAGAQLSRELADLALYIRDDHLADPARRALRLVLEEPPQDLAGAEGWEAVREFLDENLELLYEDGENGEIAAHRLSRPYLQGLRTHDMTGARLRSLGESMNALLSLYEESLGEQARGWLFSELERLAAEGLPSGGHARRLMRTAAKSVGKFYRDGETMPAMELTQALERAGVSIYPADEEKLERCPAPQKTFHRLEGSYGDDPRFKVLGEFEPAATTGGDGVTETGAVTVSLGPEPSLLGFLRGDLIKSSRISGATARLVAELEALDKKRLVAELAGDAGAERAFAVEVANLVIGALKESGWQRGDDGREAFGQLFEILGNEYNITILPGYMTYRRLQELQETHGQEAVTVTVKREGARQITLETIGALYRDDLLAPLDMTWGVGPPPRYVEHLRQALPWFDAVLSGTQPGIKLSPGAVEAIKDFESPDAGSQEGVVRSLLTIMSWLVEEEAAEAVKFAKAVKEAPGLEMDFFPLPGQSYPNERILRAVERAKTPDALDVVRNTAKADGEAISVAQIAVFKGGKLISDEPQAQFGLKTLPAAREELGKVLGPILDSTNVINTVKAKLKGLLARLALLPEGPGQTDVQLAAFKTLLEGRLVDPLFDAEPENQLHKAGAYLVGRLEAANLLTVERFEGKKTIEEALAGYSKDYVEIKDMFCLVGSPELAEVRRPLVLLEGNLVQTAYLMRGVPTSDNDVLEFDRVLIDTADRLESWQDGQGALVLSILPDMAKQLIPRTLKRLGDVRGKMFKNAKADKEILPPDTARRDLIRFVLDQVHRKEDALACIEDKTYRGAFGDLVFKDVVFRSAGPYLSDKYDISIDTAVVAGADTQALVGKFKKAVKGPKPKRENAKVYSVVVPCYMQNGVTIREAEVRVGVY